MGTNIKSSLIMEVNMIGYHVEGITFAYKL